MAHPPVPAPTWIQRCRHAWRRWRLQRAGVRLTNPLVRNPVSQPEPEVVVSPLRGAALARAPQAGNRLPLDALTSSALQLFFARRLGILLTGAALQTLIDGNEPLAQQIRAGCGFTDGMEGELMDRLGTWLLGRDWVCGQPERQRPAQRVALQQAARTAGWEVAAPDTLGTFPSRPALC